MATSQPFILLLQGSSQRSGKDFNKNYSNKHLPGSRQILTASRIDLLQKVSWEKKNQSLLSFMSFSYLLFLYIYFFWLFSEHILYQLIWRKRKEKFLCSITLNTFLSRASICHLSTTGLGNNSIQVIVLSRNEAWIWLELWTWSKFIVCLRKKAVAFFFF